MCPPLRGLFRICPGVLLIPLLRDSVESQFLCDGVLPTGRVSSVGGFLLSFSWFRFLSACLWCTSSSAQSSLLPSTLLCGLPSASSGLPWGFSTSLRCRLVFPVCACFVSLTPFGCSLLLEIFPTHSLSLRLPIYLVLYPCSYSCVIHFL